MSQFIHIGFGNIVNTDKIIAVVSPDFGTGQASRTKGEGDRKRSGCHPGQTNEGGSCDGKQSVDFVGAAAGDDCGEGSAAAGYAAVCRGGKTG